MDSIELNTGNNSDKKDMKMVIRTECSRKNVISGSSKDGLKFFCTSNIDNNCSNAESPAEESVSSERIAGVFPRRNIFDLTSTEESKSNMLSLKHKGEMFRKIETGESVSDLATPYNVAISTTSDIQDKKRNILPFASNSESKNNSSSSDFNVGCIELSKTSTQQHLPDEIKIEIIQRLEKGESVVSLSHIYKVPRNKIIYLKNNKNKLKCALRDNAAYMWYLETLYDVEVVTETDLCKKALELNKTLSGRSSFKAGSHWLCDFKSCYGIKQLQKKMKTSNEKTRSPKECLQLYLNDLQKKGFLPDNVYTANVFEIEWQSMPKNSIIFERKRKWLQKPERITVMVCANTSRSHALRLLVIGNKDCFQRVPFSPVNYQSQENSSMNFKIFREWYKNKFIPDVKTEYGLREKGKKVLLLLHYVPFPVNLNMLHKDEENFEVETLPSHLIPVDQIRKLKRMFKTNILRSLLSPTENEEITKYLEKCCCMLDNVWKTLWDEKGKEASGEYENQKQMAANAGVFKPEIDTEEFLNLFRKMPGCSQCTKQNALEWLLADIIDPSHPVLDENERVASLISEEYSKDYDRDDADEVDWSPTNPEASAALQMAYEYCEEQREFC